MPGRISNRIFKNVTEDFSHFYYLKLQTVIIFLLLVIIQLTLAGVDCCKEVTLGQSRCIVPAGGLDLEKLALTNPTGSQERIRSIIQSSASPVHLLSGDGLQMGTKNKSFESDSKGSSKLPSVAAG